MGLFSIFAFTELNKTRWRNSLLITIIIFGLLVYFEVRHYGNKFDTDLFKEIVINRNFVYTVIIVRILFELFGSRPKVIPTIPYTQHPIDFIPIPPHFETEPTPTANPKLDEILNRLQKMSQPTPAPTADPKLAEIINQLQQTGSYFRAILYLIIILIIGVSVYGVMKYKSTSKKSKARKH